MLITSYDDSEVKNRKGHYDALPNTEENSWSYITKLVERTRGKCEVPY